MSAELLADLVRIKALFQARTVAALLGADPNGIRLVNGEIIERLKFIPIGAPHGNTMCVSGDETGEVS